MKKSSFTGLLYREYYLGKNSYVINFIVFLCFVAVGWLAVLSIKYGNFGLLFEATDISSGILKNKAAVDMIRMVILTGIKYMPLIYAASIVISTADVSAKDTLNSWIRFEHCTPVTPMKYAAVKTIATAIGAAVSFALSVAYMFSVMAALGDTFTYGDFSVVMLFFTALTVWGILAQIFITLFRSRDTGMVISMLMIMFPVFIISGTGSMKESENNGIEPGDPLGIDIMMSELTEKTQALCPIMLLVLLGSFVLMFVSFYLIYKRREK